MILQINPTDFLDIVGECGRVTYILGFVIVLVILTAGKMWHEWRKESKSKDVQIENLALNIIKIKDEDANRALLNLEVFNKLTDALDKILVDDRENAEAIKVLIKEIRSEIKSNKELFMMKIDHVEDLVTNEKSR